MATVAQDEFEDEEIVEGPHLLAVLQRDLGEGDLAQGGPAGELLFEGGAGHVHDEIEFMPLQPAGVAGGDGADLRRLHDVPVELAVEIGRTRMTIGQTLELRPGSVETDEQADAVVEFARRRGQQLNEG